jgi:hypothetical protein
MTDDPVDMAEIAKSFWAKVWEDSPFDETAYDGVMHGYNKKLAVHEDEISVEHLVAAIRMTNNSTSGPDGVPYKVYRILEHIAAPILHRVANCLAGASPSPAGFNYALLYLLLKKDSGLPKDLRPLTVTNSDNRIIAIALKNILHDPFRGICDPHRESLCHCGNIATIQQ